MKALLVTGIIVLALLLIGQVRVGARAVYGAAGPEVFLRVGAVYKRIFPLKRDKKQKGKKKRDEGEAGERKEQKGGGFARFKAFLPIIGDTLGRLKSKLSVDLLEIRFTAASGDPATTAMMFGGFYAGLGTVLPALENIFKVKKRDISADADFSAREPTVFARAALSLRIREILYIGIRFVFMALRSGTLKHSAPAHEPEKRKQEGI